MKTRLTVLALALAMIGSAPEAHAQTDSTEVVVIDRTDLNVIVTPEGPVRRFRGDSVQFTAVAVDTVSGDTLDVSFTWASSNSNVVSIDAVTGMAHFLSRGNATITVEVLELISTILMIQADDGTWAEFVDGYQVAADDWRPICAYHELSDGRVVHELGPGYDYHWGVGASDLTAEEAVVESANEPRALTAALTGPSTPPAMPDCPSWEAVLPLTPMDFQLTYFVGR